MCCTQGQYRCGWGAIISGEERMVAEGDFRYSFSTQYPACMTCREIVSRPEKGKVSISFVDNSLCCPWWSVSQYTVGCCVFAIFGRREISLHVRLRVGQRPLFDAVCSSALFHELSRLCVFKGLRLEGSAGAGVVNDTCLQVFCKPVRIQSHPPTLV